MSGRLPGVKAGDRVRVTTVHTGIITRIDDDSFVLETGPGRPMHGNFHGDGEMTWQVLKSELPNGAVVRIEGLLNGAVRVFERDDGAGSYPAVWCGAGDHVTRTWAHLCDLGTPVELVPRDAWSVPVASEPSCQSEPPVGTVVIDKNGLAWQRGGGLDYEMPWWPADSDEPDQSWDALNGERGPLTVIYEGDGGESAPC